jgi:hypothetical protein
MHGLRSSQSSALRVNDLLTSDAIMSEFRPIKQFVTDLIACCKNTETSKRQNRKSRTSSILILGPDVHWIMQGVVLPDLIDTFVTLPRHFVTQSDTSLAMIVEGVSPCSTNALRLNI